MRWFLVGFVALTTAPAVAREPSPLAWTPDGSWVAYVSATRTSNLTPAPGWVFGREAPAPPTGPLAYRLWATRPSTGASVLLEESAAPLTSPGWSPDGKALAFGRVVAEAGGKSRFEVVIQEAPDRQRVLRRESLALAPAEAEDLHGRSVPWSPDGRMLAAPRLQPPGLVVLRADDGGLVQALDDAALPAWAPRGARLAYFDRPAVAPGFRCLNFGLGEPRHLIGGNSPVGPPAWSTDGKSLWTLGREPAGAVQLLKLGAEGQEPEILRPLTEPGAAEPPPLSASFTVDRSGQDLYSTVLVEGQPSVITHQRLREVMVMKRWNPVDALVPLGALAASPDGKWLALRAGPSGPAAVPALCLLEDQRLTPLVPDDATRAEWLASLIATARLTLRDAAPPPIWLGGPAERPTLIPAPGEPNRPGDGPIRLRHLADLGRPLCDRPESSPPPTPALAALLAEARLFFAGLREDHDDALAALAAYEPSVVDPDRRLRLLALRAQIYLGRGDTERARAAVAYLRQARPDSPGRFEQTPSGPVLTADPDPLARWIAYLAGRVEGTPVAPDQAAAAPPAAEPDRRPAFLPPRPLPVGNAPPRRRRPFILHPVDVPPRPVPAP